MGISKREALTMIGVLVFIWLAYGAITLYQNAQSFAVEKMRIREVNLTNVADGTHFGLCHYDGFDVEVKVKVLNHRIEEIVVLSNARNQYAKKGEAIVAKVKEAQSLKVDVISGATVTSKALLKATERALKSKPANY